MNTSSLLAQTLVVKTLMNNERLRALGFKMSVESSPVISWKPSRKDFVFIEFLEEMNAYIVSSSVGTEFFDRGDYKGVESYVEDAVSLIIDDLSRGFFKKLLGL